MYERNETPKTYTANYLIIIKDNWQYKKCTILCRRSNFKVPRTGLEPARSYEHMALNHACLPVPTPGQRRDKNTLFFDFM